MRLIQICLQHVAKQSVRHRGILKVPKMFAGSTRCRYVAHVYHFHPSCEPTGLWKGGSLLLDGRHPVHSHWTLWLPLCLWRCRLQGHSHSRPPRLPGSIRVHWQCLSLWLRPLQPLLWRDLWSRKQVFHNREVIKDQRSWIELIFACAGAVIGS